MVSFFPKTLLKGTNHSHGGCCGKVIAAPIARSTLVFAMGHRPKSKDEKSLTPVVYLVSSG